MSHWGRYVPVAERRAKAARRAKQLAKGGRTLNPVCASPAITTTFWGNAWCDNLSDYSDFSNRLPRGQRYARNGSVIDLQISKGHIEALVSGRDIYQIKINIAPLADTQWQVIQTNCAGQISSLVELLSGDLSDGVMRIVTEPGEGLFPQPSEITLSCSCPDWAELCKHNAAVLYCVGAQLDSRPALLFSLRGVDPTDLLEQAINAGIVLHGAGRAPRLEAVDLSAIFGVDIDFSDTPLTPAPSTLEPTTDLDGLSSEAIRTLALIALGERPGISAVMGELSLSRAVATKALNALKRRKLVVFRGAARTGGYHLPGDSTS